MVGAEHAHRGEHPNTDTFHVLPLCTKVHEPHTGWQLMPASAPSVQPPMGPPEHAHRFAAQLLPAAAHTPPLHS